MMKWLLLLLCAFALHARAVQVVDDRGVAVELPQPPRRGSFCTAGGQLE